MTRNCRHGISFDSGSPPTANRITEGVISISLATNLEIILFTQVSVFSVRALTKDYPFRALVRGFLIPL